MPSDIWMSDTCRMRFGRATGSATRVRVSSNQPGSTYRNRVNAAAAHAGANIPRNTRRFMIIVYSIFQSTFNHARSAAVGWSKSAMRLLLLFAATLSAQDIDPGRLIFESRCARCHGADGSGGDMGPDIRARQAS